MGEAGGMLSSLAGQTPTTRERYVDFLRAGSIMVVVFGHWLMAVVTVKNGRLHVGNVIAITPGLWALTWALQVMPIFFFVGGFANAAGLSGRATSTPYAEWVRSRVARLMRPVGLLLAIWIPIMLVLEHTSIDQKNVKDLTTLVSQPLWFIGVYLIVSAAAPPMLALYRRAPVGSILGLMVGAIVVDIGRFAGNYEQVGYVNFALIWLIAQQLGFAYHSGALRTLRPLQWVGLGASAVAALTALVQFGPYPASMVGLPGQKISNMAPPTVCLLALMVLQVSIVMLLRDRATAWLERPGPWKFTIAVNSVIMTIFCWHLTAAVIAVAGLQLAGIPFAAGGSSMWWVTRLPWLAGLLVLLGGLIWLFGRFERGALIGGTRPAPLSASRASTMTAILAVVLLIVGLLGIAGNGLTHVLETRTPILGFIGVSPITSLAEMMLGVALSRAFFTPRESHRGAAG